MQEAARWYTLRVQRGKEKKVRQAILNLRENDNLQEYILDVVVPIEILEVIDKNGKKRTTERAVYSGYVFVKLLLDPYNIVISRIEALYRVQGFISDANRLPVPLSQEDVDKILAKAKETPKPKPKFEFDKGEVVIINDDGEFSGIEASVEDYNPENGMLKLSFTLLNRQHFVEVFYQDVKKKEY